MKILSIFIISIFITILLYALNIHANDNIIQTVYNVIGIIFSIGMGLIVTFSMSGVESKKYVTEIRKSINGVRNKFILIFFICTLLFISYQHIPRIEYEISDMCILIDEIIKIHAFVFLVLALVYLITNFIRIQVLKDDIFDKILEKKENND